MKRETGEYIRIHVPSYIDEIHNSQDQEDFRVFNSISNNKKTLMMSPRMATYLIDQLRLALHELKPTEANHTHGYCDTLGWEHWKPREIPTSPPRKKNTTLRPDLGPTVADILKQMEKLDFKISTSTEDVIKAIEKLKRSQ